MDSDGQPDPVPWLQTSIVLRTIAAATLADVIGNLNDTTMKPVFEVATSTSVSKATDDGCGNNPKWPRKKPPKSELLRAAALLVDIAGQSTGRFSETVAGVAHAIALAGNRPSEPEEVPPPEGGSRLGAHAGIVTQMIAIASVVDMIGNLGDSAMKPQLGQAASAALGMLVDDWCGTGRRPKIKKPPKKKWEILELSSVLAELADLSTGGYADALGAASQQLAERALGR